MTSMGVLWIGCEARKLVDVVAYVWMEGGSIAREVAALEYWPPSGTKTDDGRRYVQRGEGFARLSRPTHERLSDGSVVPMRRTGNPRTGKLEFARRRVAAQEKSVGRAA